MLKKVILLVFFMVVSNSEILPDIEICMEEVFTSVNISHPIFASFDVNGSDLFLAERGGVIKQVNLKLRKWKMVLDISERVLTGKEVGDERGLLGFAMSNINLSVMYVSYTKETKTPNFDHKLVISKFKVSRGTTQVKVDPDSEKTLMEIDQPGKRQNGGLLFFGHDSNLYIAVGAGGDSQMDSFRFKKTSWLGKILRLDVSDAKQLYSIPKTNPYYTDDDANTKKEIYASGFRNPFKCHVGERTTGVTDDTSRNVFQIICGDLGAGDRNTDEVDIIRNGGIYGWLDLPDLDCGDLDQCHQLAGKGEIPVSNILPIYTHYHEKGQALIGGAVYKGRELTRLKEAYVYGDYIHDTLHYLKEEDDGSWSKGNIARRYPHQKEKDAFQMAFLIGFVVDHQSELLALKYHIKPNNESRGESSLYRMRPGYKCNASVGTMFQSLNLMAVVLSNICFPSIYYKLN